MYVSPHICNCRLAVIVAQVSAAMPSLRLVLIVLVRDSSNSVRDCGKIKTSVAAN
jgi:hypothetical protein